MLFGMLWLTQLDVDSSYLTVVIGLVAFGFGLGLAMAPMTDTVMAAVPVNSAGIGSATNDVSRELGSALGIAVLGSVVNALYRSDVKAALADTPVPADVVDKVADSPVLASTITNAANTAFVDSITSVFYVGAGFVVAAVLFAITLVPTKMRAEQAVLEVPPDVLEEGRPIMLPEPVRSRIVRALICAFCAVCGRVVGQGRCRCHQSPALEYASGD